MKLEDIYAEAPVFLKQAQREFYYEKGYLVFPSLIGHNELAALRTAAGKLVDSTRQLTQSPRQIDLEKGHNAKSPRLRRAAYLDDLDPVFWDFCKDSIIPAIAADLLGPNVRFRDLMLNFKWAGGGAAAKWHQDIAFYPHTHSGAMQFLVFLEDVSSDQGPLQVVSGSHQGQIFEHYDDRREWTGAIKDSDIQNAGLNLPLADYRVCRNGVCASQSYDSWLRAKSQPTGSTGTSYYLQRGRRGTLYRPCLSQFALRQNSPRSRAGLCAS